MEDKKIKVNILPKGPILMEGSFEIILPHGAEEVKEGKIALCRCGYSKNKPYCDGAHKDCPVTDLI